MPEAAPTPPHRHIASTRTTASHASSILQTYLHNSESHPHLHPDALITPSDVTFSSHGGSLGGVVMHNLRRVAAGLRGEYLEVERTPEVEGEDEEGRKGKGDKAGASAPAWDYVKGGWQGGEGEARAGAAEEGWQDLAEYEAQQGGIEVGEIGDRSNFVGSGGAAPGVEIEGEGEVVGGVKKRKSEGDKAARKKAKKEKERELKKRKEMERKGKGDE